jgi:hypothetical protein
MTNERQCVHGGKPICHEEATFERNYQLIQASSHNDQHHETTEQILFSFVFLFSRFVHFLIFVFSLVVIDFCCLVLCVVGLLPV